MIFRCQTIIVIDLETNEDYPDYVIPWGEVVAEAEHGEDYETPIAIALDDLCMFTHTT